VSPSDTSGASAGRTVIVGRTGIRPFYADNIAALPTLHVELVGDLADGDRAALEWRAEGSTPTGDPVRMHGANLVTVHEGRFTEFHAYWNAVG
jgi:ketosteroid isomerase-like protein